MLMTLFFVLELKLVLKIESNAWGNLTILYYKTNREALTVLCFVVKHLETLSLHFFRALTASCVLS